MIAATPKPPYYAVIFTNELTVHTEGYEAMAEKNVRNGITGTWLSWF